MNRKLFCVVVLVCVVGLSSAAFAADEHLGTWKVNLTKSNYNPANLAPKSQVCKTEAMGNAAKTTCDVVDYQGKSVHYDFTTNYDGKDATVTGDPNRDQTALKKVDDFTFDQTNKKSGKVTTNTHTVYARDGKSRTLTTTGVNAQGQKVANTTAWDKQ